MPVSKESRPPDYFARLYDANPDPWDFEGSAYEHEKYDATLATLDGRHFRSALEIGCSIGVLTARLASQCDRLLALDIVDSALARARARCASLHHVRFENRHLPQDWPDDGTPYDLILLSEVLYFLHPDDICRLAVKAAAALAPGGVALLVNYTEAIDEPCSGGEAAALFIAASGLAPVRHLARPKYRIDLLTA
jgi:predicted TPR repeat methyltransferase